MNVVDMSSHVLFRADYVIPIAVLPDRTANSGQAPVLPGERLFDLLNDSRGVSVGNPQDTVKMVRQHDPGDERKQRLLMCAVQSAGQERGVLHENWLSVSDNRCNETVLTWSKISQELGHAGSVGSLTDKVCQ